MRGLLIAIVSFVLLGGTASASFSVAGDFGATLNTQAVLEEASDTDFMLGVGDLSWQN